MEHLVANRTSVRIPLTEELSPFHLEELIGSRAWESLSGDASRSIYDRLAEILTLRWSTSFAGVADPVQLYERFELFCLLQLFKHRGIDEESLNDSIKANQCKRLVNTPF